MICLLQSHANHGRQILDYSQISFDSQYYALPAVKPWVWKKKKVVWITSAVGLTSDKLICQWSVIPYLGDVYNKKYLVTFGIENLWLFCCIAHSLEDGRLACIGAADDEDTKTLGKLWNRIRCLSLLPFGDLRWLNFGIGQTWLRHLWIRWWWKQRKWCDK